MIEVLEFIFSSFWRWLGTLVLVESITGALRYAAAAAIAKAKERGG